MKNKDKKDGTAKAQEAHVLIALLALTSETYF
jgi:hypothetical protein